MRLLPVVMTAAGMSTSPGIRSCPGGMSTDPICRPDSPPASSPASPVDAPATAELRRRGMLELLPWSYSTTAHAELRSSVAEQLGVDPERLGSLHEIEAEQGRPPRRRRRRLIMQQQARANPAAVERLHAAYERFVCEVLAPNLAAEWGSDETDAVDDADETAGALTAIAYQAMPALRVSPPATQAMGRRHHDAVYGHQPGQLNYWLPLAAAWGENTLWVEPTTCQRSMAADPTGSVRADAEAEARAVPLEGSFGDCWRFYGNLDYHSTRPNNTSGTRVSLDFRVVPGALYTNDYAGSRRSESGVQMFAVGTASRTGFYKIARRDSATGEWRPAPPPAEDGGLGLSGSGT